MLSCVLVMMGNQGGRERRNEQQQRQLCTLCVSYQSPSSSCCCCWWGQSHFCWAYNDTHSKPSTTAQGEERRNLFRLSFSFFFSRHFYVDDVVRAFLSWKMTVFLFPQEQEKKRWFWHKRKIAEQLRWDGESCKIEFAIVMARDW